MFELASRLVGVYKVNHMVSTAIFVVAIEIVLTMCLDEKCYRGESRLFDTKSMSYGYLGVSEMLSGVHLKGVLRQLIVSAVDEFHHHHTVPVP